MVGAGEPKSDPKSLEPDPSLGTSGGHLLGNPRPRRQLVRKAG